MYSPVSTSIEFRLQTMLDELTEEFVSLNKAARYLPKEDLVDIIPGPDGINRYVPVVFVLWKEIEKVEARLTRIRSMSR